MGLQQQYDWPISATSVNTTVTFGFDPSYLLLINDGPNSVRLSFVGEPAATDSFELGSGESIAITAKETVSGLIGGRIDAICAASETSVTRVLALR